MAFSSSATWHQARVLPVQRLPAVAELLHGAGAIGLDQHVGALEQALEHVAVGHVHIARRHRLDDGAPPLNGTRISLALTAWENESAFV
jgi:hypothetical protein